MKKCLLMFVCFLGATTQYAMAQESPTPPIITVAPGDGGWYDTTLATTFYRTGFLGDLKIKVCPPVVPNGWVTDLRVKLVGYLDGEPNETIYDNSDLASQVVVVDGVWTLDLSVWNNLTYYPASEKKYFVIVIWGSWNGTTVGAGGTNSSVFKLVPNSYSP